jgi:hypothetical protein
LRLKMTPNAENQGERPLINLSPKPTKALRTNEAST